MKYNKELHKKMLAAKAILFEPTTTREKFSHARDLIEGFHPDLDQRLREVDETISTVEKVIEGKIIQLTAENLPEDTEENKKRKRALLLFIGSWNKLKSEVARVEKELEASKADGAHGASGWGKIIMGGGIFTVVAVGIVVGLQTVAVDVVVHNEGCGTMQMSGSTSISLPGIHIPSGAISSGETMTATLPPLPVTIDGTKSGAIIISALTLNANFNLPGNIDDVTMNGESLLGKKTDLNLSSQKSHDFVLRCN